MTDVLRDRVTCGLTGHVDGCPGYVGGDHECIRKPLDATRCVVCGHRMDDLSGCDSCAADREAAELEGWFDA